jgi:hypothetical protein
MVTMIAHRRARIVALRVPGNGVLFCAAAPGRTMQA